MSEDKIFLTKIFPLVPLIFNTAVIEKYGLTSSMYPREMKCWGTETTSREQEMKHPTTVHARKKVGIPGRLKQRP